MAAQRPGFKQEDGDVKHELKRFSNGNSDRHVPIRDILIERRGIAEHGPAVSGAGVVIDM